MPETKNTQFAQLPINERNLDRYLEMLDEWFTMESEMLPTPLKGREAVRQLYESYFKGVPDLRIEIEQVLTSGDYVVIRSHVTGIHQGIFMGIPAKPWLRDPDTRTNIRAPAGTLLAARCHLTRVPEG